MASSVLRIMNVEAVLHMKEGIGEHSYAQNSALQRKSMDALRSAVVSAAVDVYLLLRPERFAVADLGCASGPNALSLVEDVIGAVGGICRLASQPSPEFSVLLNDLPTNDFNTVFAKQPGFITRLRAAASADVFLSGVPGSFYGRIFPRRSLHFVCSCSSLHWLSQVPPGVCNRGKMYISHTSPTSVAVAYFEQFQRDFSLFLRSRAAEVVAGGKMVLAMLGRRTEDPADRRTNLLWELLADAFAVLVGRGLVEEEAVDAYNVPFYAPSAREIAEEVLREGSFRIECCEAYEVELGGDGRSVAMAIRAIQEPMLRSFFEAEVVDALFESFAALLGRAMAVEEVVSAQIAVVLTRLP